MSAIITIPGRPTTDPQIMQAKNSGSTYTNLDIPVTQRGQDGNKETIFYNCHFNSFQADRLIKAGVKKGTAIIVYGKLELHPFIHSKGQNQGKANAGPQVTVLDWEFAPSTFSDENGANPGAPNGFPPNGGGQPNTQNGYGQPAGTPNGGYQASGGYQQNGYHPQQGGFAQNPAPAQNNYAPQGNMPQNNQPAGGYQTPPQQNGYAPAQNGAAPQNPPAGTMQGGYMGDGFTQVPESEAPRLPFAA